MFINVLAKTSLPLFKFPNKNKSKSPFSLPFNIPDNTGDKNYKTIPILPPYPIKKSC